jgi:hypothetical protein
MTRSIISRLRTIAALVLLVSTPAFGGPDTASAQSLYDEATTLYGAGDYAAACPKFEASYQVNPQDLDAQGMLALCYEKLGKLATAWGHFRELKAKATKPEQVTVADAHITALEPRLARLTIHAATSNVQGLVIQKNGAIVPLASLNATLAIDQGTYKLEAQAPGFAQWTQILTISDGQTKEVTIPALAPQTPAPPPVSNEHKTAGSEPADEESVEDESPSPPRSPSMILPIGLGAGGLAAVGLGLVFGMKAKSNWGDAQDTCMGAISMCPEARAMEAQSQVDRARNMGLISTVFVGVGVVSIGAAVGSYFWLSTRRTPDPAETAYRLRPVAGRHSTGLVLEGNW